MRPGVAEHSTDVIDVAVADDDGAGWEGIGNGGSGTDVEHDAGAGFAVGAFGILRLEDDGRSHPGLGPGRFDTKEG